MTCPEPVSSGLDARADKPPQQPPGAKTLVVLVVPEDLRVTGWRDRHRAGVVMRRGFARDPLSLGAFTATMVLLTVATNITGTPVTSLLLGLVVGPAAWVLATYTAALVMRRAWMLATPDGVAVLQLKKNGTIRTFAASPAGRDISDQLLQRVTDEADRARADLQLSCHRERIAFYGRHGFTITGRQPRWSPLPVRMDRAHREDRATRAPCARGSSISGCAAEGVCSRRGQPGWPDEGKDVVGSSDRLVGSCTTMLGSGRGYSRCCWTAAGRPGPS